MWWKGERERAAPERERFIGAGLRSGPAALCEREEPASAWRSPDRKRRWYDEKSGRRLGFAAAQKSARTCADHSRMIVSSHLTDVGTNPVGVLDPAAEGATAGFQQLLRQSSFAAGSAVPPGGTRSSA